MKKRYYLLIIAVIILGCLAAVDPGSRISRYWYVGTALDDSDVAIFERTNAVPNTNVTAHWSDIRNAATNGLATIIYVTNIVFVTSNSIVNQIINSELFTNENGFVHLVTNAPIVLGTNSGPPVAFYQFTGITNDSMSAMELDFAPLAGTGQNRSGLFVWMSSGDAIGGYAPAIYALSQGTTSNGFGAYCGNVPFGLLGKVDSAGSGDSVATIGNNLGGNTGVRYGVSGLSGGSVNNGNTNVGVFGSGGTNSSVAVGVYAELANGISTATDAKYPLTSALILNNRQTAGRLATGYTNSTYEVWSLLGNGHMQLNSNEVYTLVQGTNIIFITNGTQVTIHGTASGSGSANLTGTTNFLQLSPQAAKLPVTNYPGIDAGWQDWELLYYKTNAEGSIASLSSQFQFIVPQDYATNTMKLRVYSLLSTTNGPNSSNTIFRASVLRATPGDTTDLHTNLFGSTTSGTITWSASATGTNKIQSVVINMSTASALAAGDLCILKLDRDAATDTFGGVMAVVGLQLEYTRP